MNLERKSLKYAAIPVALAASLGLSACVGTEAPETPDTGALDEIRLIGPSKNDYVNAVNAGPEVTVYDPGTSQNIGTIASNGAFEIVCQTVKPNAFVVQVSPEQQGQVNLTNHLTSALATSGNTAIQSC